LADWRCGNPATQTAYVEGISYALQTLHRRTPHAALTPTPRWAPTVPTVGAHGVA